MSSVIKFFLDGGIFMLFLLICSVISVTVMIWRGMALRREEVVPTELRHAVEAGNHAENRVMELVKGNDSALARILSVVLRHLRWPKAENMEAVQVRARAEMVKLEKGMVVLDVMVGVTPLLGLLGTVAGLVTIFSGLGAEGTADPHIIAGGIAEALNTTIMGLAIAMPSLIAHSYFTKKIEEMAIDMETLVADFMTTCYRQEVKLPERETGNSRRYAPKNED